MGGGLSLLADSRRAWRDVVERPGTGVAAASGVFFDPAAIASSGDLKEIARREPLSGTEGIAPV